MGFIKLLIFVISFLICVLGGQSHAQQGSDPTVPITPTPAISVEDYELHETAIARMVASDYQGWKFQQTAKDGDDVMIEHFDSSREPEVQRTLISKNGREPSAGDIREYKKNKEQKRISNAQSELDESNNDFLKILVKPGTLRVTDKNDRTVTYAFRPQFIKQQDKGLEDHVYGSMVVTRDNPWVEQVHLFNLEEFKMNSANIREFQQKMSFAPISESAEAPVFFKRVEVTIKGKAMGLFSIDKKIKVDFTEYEMVD